MWYVPELRLSKQIQKFFDQKNSSIFYFWQLCQLKKSKQETLNNNLKLQLKSVLF